MIRWSADAHRGSARCLYFYMCAGVHVHAFSSLQGAPYGPMRLSNQNQKFSLKSIHSFWDIYQLLSKMGKIDAYWIQDPYCDVDHAHKLVTLWAWCDMINDTINSTDNMSIQNLPIARHIALLPARRTPQGLVVIGVCLSVCLSVCAYCFCPQDISRTGSWITTKFGGWEQGVNL